jgi:hypothetical protein
MTPILKTLLHKYGLLYISITGLSSERPGSELKSLEEYDDSLGELEEDEPAVVVRVSESGEHKLRHAGKHEFVLKRLDGAVINNVSLLEMPEDEFHFVEAFRRGLFDLQNELPAFIYGLGQVYAYSLFESYIVVVLKDRLKKHPECMGQKKQVAYSEIFSALSKDALLDAIISKEVNDILYLPIGGVLDYLRSKLGFSHLPTDREANLMEISLVRNCLIHNDSKVSARLAAEFPETYKLNEAIAYTHESFSNCLHTLRKILVSIDHEWEKLA